MEKLESSMSEFGSELVSDWKCQFSDENHNMFNKFIFKLNSEEFNIEINTNFKSNLHLLN
jgi:hypothetical protein